MDRTRPVYHLMREKPGWSLAYEDRTAAVFARVGSPTAEWLADVEPPPWPEDGAGMTFPVRGSS